MLLGGPDSEVPVRTGTGLIKNPRIVPLRFETSTSQCRTYLLVSRLLVLYVHLGKVRWQRTLPWSHLARLKE
jgi:hypothetical protein